ncbi:chemotaxis protein CheW [Sphingomonas canadensis]|uniref:Chemotaxis protein CheW n=2 Tax=Sphingomonas canadensis TaxID=1219257 RepID=A0ABW3H7F3_9SPHN|nr:chemotaxis protein CheW [Sphingomonas canadensis]
MRLLRSVASVRRETGVRRVHDERDNRTLLFRARARLCALPLAALREVMRPLPAETLPDMPPFLIGVARIRGEPVPVADAGALLGEGGAPAFTRYVSLRSGGGAVALAVESVLGVREIAPDAFGRLPRLLRGAGRDVVSAIGSLDSDLLNLLELGRTVTGRMRGVLAPEAPR